VLPGGLAVELRLGHQIADSDYRAISPQGWHSLGVAAPAPLPDQFEAVTAWARHAAAGD
jgi:hypothetical protein